MIHSGRVVLVTEIDTQRAHACILKLRDLQPEKTQSLDDKGFSAIFANLFRDFLRFNVTAGRWYFYDGRRWAEDVGGVYAANCARDMADYLLIYGRRIEDEGARERFIKAAIRYGGLRYRETLIRDAQALLAIQQSEFDQRANLLNLQNCTLDLETMETHLHSPADLLTKLAGANYSPSADPVRWETFLQEVFPGDIEKIAYLQRMCGYCLTAGTELECMFFLYGPTTRNGKSSFAETVERMLGDYAANAQPETLAVNHRRNGGTATPELARLAGVRFVHLPESPGRMLLDVALVKQLTGGDTITARNLYAKPFQYRPAFKLFVNTNSLPTVTDDTLFSSDRVRIIGFDRHFTTAEQNPYLKQELAQPENLSAVLNWALEGLKLYRLTGERPPACVRLATDDFKLASDKIVRFFAEVMEAATENTAGGAVYDSFVMWCAANGFTADTKGAFFSALRERGLMKKTGTVAGKTEKNVVCGYRIIGD